MSGGFHWLGRARGGTTGVGCTAIAMGCVGGDAVVVTVPKEMLEFCPAKENTTGVDDLIKTMYTGCASDYPEGGIRWGIKNV